jgi:hypothetical protein
MFRVFLFLAISATAGLACASEPGYFQAPGFKLKNRDAAALSADWWKWAMSSPAEINPVQDRSGENCGVGQEGKVWFLAGGFGSSKIRRRCTIPSDKYLFFPVINMAYWPREANDGYTCDRAKASAAMNNDTALDLFVEVDGVSLKDPKRYRARSSKCFDIYERVPESVKPYRAYPSASDGYWILIRPLKKGKHTIKFWGRYNNATTDYGRMVQDIEYEISVGELGSN